MQILAIIQARSGSQRLPRKVLLKIRNKSLLQIHVERVKQSKLINQIVIATTTNLDDNLIVDIANNMNVKNFRGSEIDVLDRYYNAAILYKPDYIVRLTSDCPLIDPILIDEIIEKAIKDNYDYYTNVFEEKYPDGQDIEVFTFDALEKAWKLAKLKSEREHVTPFIRENSTYKGGSIFKSSNHFLNKDYSKVRLTVDEYKDYLVIEKLINKFGTNKDWKTYADYYLSSQETINLNSSIIRNEGYLNSIKNDKNES